jgi:adenine phosphoribosyltransferase
MPQAAPSGEAVEDLKKYIREVPDWPKPGILFYDITTLLKNPTAFQRLLDALAAQYQGQGIELVLAVEARGFIFGAALAARLGAGFVPVRKPRKLPAQTASVTYELEYGTDTLEIHKDAIMPGQKVLILDDLLATGGTAAACVELARSLGAEIVGVGFAVELTFLNGRKKLEGENVFSLLKYGS